MDIVLIARTVRIIRVAVAIIMMMKMTIHTVAVAEDIPAVARVVVEAAVHLVAGVRPAAVRVPAVPSTPSAPVKKDILPIAAIQKQLNLLGYNCGEENGTKNENTINAIKTFQIEYGLTADGYVDWETESWLNSTKIEAIREALTKLGYKFNPSLGNGRTQEVINAIYDFQARHNLDQNGRIDLKTKRALGLGG